MKFKLPNALTKIGSELKARLRDPATGVQARLNNRAIIGIFILVAGWNIALSSRWGQEHFLGIQLRFYKLLWSLRPMPRYNSTVNLVRIDDSLHWGQGPCDSPTSRHLLAALIGNASQVQHKAKVIALDIELFAPRGKPAGSHNPDPNSEDAELLRAINNAARTGVTVVLPVGFVKDKDKRRRIPNIYKDEELPLADDSGKCGYAACAILGFIDLPQDKREIPLQEMAADFDEYAQPKQYKSFSMAAADAQASGHVPPSTKPTLKEVIASSEPIFGSFLPEAEFTKHEIIAQDLASGKEEAKTQAESNLLVIGGEWHSEQGYGRLEDLHLSPVGSISGVLLHANYIEALLGDHFSQPVPVWMAILVDLLIGLFLYISLDVNQGWFGKLSILLLFVIPAGVLLLAYIFFVNFGRYLDFVLPTMLYFVHLLYEHAKHYFKLLREKPI
jgi:CHASE2 domain-containing sensor protein